MAPENGGIRDWFKHPSEKSEKPKNKEKDEKLKELFLDTNEKLSLDLINLAFLVDDDKRIDSLDVKNNDKLNLKQTKQGVSGKFKDVLRKSEVMTTDMAEFGGSYHLLGTLNQIRNNMPGEEQTDKNNAFAKKVAEIYGTFYHSPQDGSLKGVKTFSELQDKLTGPVQDKWFSLIRKFSGHLGELFLGDGIGVDGDISAITSDERQNMVLTRIMEEYGPVIRTGLKEFVTDKKGGLRRQIKAMKDSDSLSDEQRQIVEMFDRPRERKDILTGAYLQGILLGLLQQEHTITTNLVDKDGNIFDTLPVEDKSKDIATIGASWGKVIVDSLLSGKHISVGGLSGQGGFALSAINGKQANGGAASASLGAIIKVLGFDVGNTSHQLNVGATIVGTIAKLQDITMIWNSVLSASWDADWTKAERNAKANITTSAGVGVDLKNRRVGPYLSVGRDKMSAIQEFERNATLKVSDAAAQYLLDNNTNIAAILSKDLNLVEGLDSKWSDQITQDLTNMMNLVNKPSFKTKLDALNTKLNGSEKTLEQAAIRAEMDIVVAPIVEPLMRNIMTTLYQQTSKVSLGGISLAPTSVVGLGVLNLQKLAADEIESKPRTIDGGVEKAIDIIKPEDLKTLKSKLAIFSDGVSVDVDTKEVVCTNIKVAIDGHNLGSDVRIPLNSTVHINTVDEKTTVSILTKTKTTDGFTVYNANETSVQKLTESGLIINEDVSKLRVDSEHGWDKIGASVQKEILEVKPRFSTIADIEKYYNSVWGGRYVRNLIGSVDIIPSNQDIVDLFKPEYRGNFTSADEFRKQVLPKVNCWLLANYQNPNHTSSDQVVDKVHQIYMKMLRHDISFDKRFLTINQSDQDIKGKIFKRGELQITNRVESLESASNIFKIETKLLFKKLKDEKESNYADAKDVSGLTMISKTYHYNDTKPREKLNAHRLVAQSEPGYTSFDDTFVGVEVVDPIKQSAMMAELSNRRDTETSNVEDLQNSYKEYYNTILSSAGYTVTNPNVWSSADIFGYDIVNLSVLDKKGVNSTVPIQLQGGKFCLTANIQCHGNHNITFVPNKPKIINKPGTLDDNPFDFNLTTTNITTPKTSIQETTMDMKGYGRKLIGAYAKQIINQTNTIPQKDVPTFEVIEHEGYGTGTGNGETNGGLGTGTGNGETNGNNGAGSGNAGGNLDPNGGLGTGTGNGETNGNNGAGSGNAGGELNGNNTGGGNLDPNNPTNGANNYITVNSLEEAKNKITILDANSATKKETYYYQYQKDGKRYYADIKLTSKTESGVLIEGEPHVKGNIDTTPSQINSLGSKSAQSTIKDDAINPIKK